jgi:hypothetical protein
MLAAAAALTAVGALTALAVVSWRAKAPAQEDTAAQEEAWGPLLGPGADVVVAVATKMHLLVRPNLPRSNVGPRFTAFPELYPAFQTHRPLAVDAKLEMETADSSVAFGEVSAIAVTTNTLSRFGGTYALMPERIAPLAALRNRNAVVIGIPMDSLVVSKLLSTTTYTIEYHPAIDELAITDRRRPEAVPRWGAVTKGPGTVNVVYGLITVLPSEGVLGAPKRTLVFSGLGAVGTNGAAEFFASPEHVTALRGMVRKRGLKRFPPAYQVVVRCNFSDGLLLSTECLALEVLNR